MLIMMTESESNKMCNSTQSTENGVDMFQSTHHFVKLRSKAEVVIQIKRLCKKNLNGFWEEMNPSKILDLFVELSECIARENVVSESVDFYRNVVHQAVLYNAALIRVDNDKAKNGIRNKINDLASQILSNLATHNSEECQQRNIVKSTKAMKSLLNNMRKRVVESIKDIPDTKKCSSQLTEKKKIQIIENIMKQTTKDYKNLMRRISEECIKMLGNIPCRFAHLAMGSLSRGVVTPYSDFENAIVFEDTDQEEELRYRKRYFRSYAVLFEMIVVGFGEAPIRLAGIDCLNDFSSPESRDKDWFWDKFTPSGIQFDSHMPFASKTPLARSTTEKKPSTVELIGRKSDILEYLKKNRALKEGYHLAEMLASTSYVAGSVKFYNEYALNAASEMKKTFQSDESFNALIHDYEQNLFRFSIHTEIEKFGSTLNVKKSLYRLFFVFLVHLERLTDVHNSCNLSRYTVEQWLKSSEGIGQESAHNLLYALSVVNEARLKLYLKRMENSDVVAGTKYLLDSQASISVFSILNKADIVNAFAIGLAWNSALTEILSKIRSQTISSNMKHCIMMCLNKHLRQRNDLYTQGLILKHFQDYESAIEAFHKCLDQNAEDKYKINVYNKIGQCHMWALEFQQASRVYETSLSLLLPLSSSTEQLHMMAELRDWMGQSYIDLNFVVAEKHINESEALWNRLRSIFPENPVYLKGLADVYDSNGWLNYRKKDFEKSLASYKKAATLFDELETLSEAKIDLRNETTKVQGGIALCYHELKRYNEAIIQMENVIDLKIKMFGAEAAVLTISFTKRKIGQCYMELGNYEKAMELFHESMQIRKASIGSEKEKISSYGNTTNEMTECYLRMNEENKAMEACKRSFMYGLTVLDEPAGFRIMRRAINLISTFVQKLHSFEDDVDANVGQLIESTITEIRNKLSNPAFDQVLEEERQMLKNIDLQK